MAPMWDDIDSSLLPSNDLQKELWKIAEETLGFKELCRQLPEETLSADPNSYIYAERGTEKLVYPMFEIPGPWTGKMMVGRMPGRGKEFTGE